LKLELSIQIDPQFEGKPDSARLSDIAHHALRTEGLNHPVTVGLLITDDTTIRRLNHRYRGQDTATDILAFGSDEGGDGFVSPPGQPRHLGDIVLSYPRAAMQAEERELPLHEELDRLLVHGLLHLLGYEDYEEEERRKMWERQESILRSVYEDGQ
jgi:probable rRNA maturation factor